MKKIRSIIIAVCVILAVFGACRKKKNSDSDTSHVVMNNMAECISNDVFKTFFYSWLSIEDSLYRPNDTANYRLHEPCTQLHLSTWDTTSWPKTLTIDFPLASCTCNDGMMRSGELDVFVSGPLKSNGSKFKIGFDHYYINSMNIDGYKNLVLLSSEGSQKMYFSDSTGYIISTSSGYLDWDGIHSLEWKEGRSSKQTIADDVYIYNGQASGAPLAGTDPSGFTFNVKILESLVFKNNCYLLEGGTLELTPLNKSQRLVTYASGCKNEATVVIDNITYTVNF